jgi:hypothetical protein
MFMTARDIESDADPAGSFTAFNRQLETRLYKWSGDFDDEPAARHPSGKRARKTDTKEDTPPPLFGQ